MFKYFKLIAAGAALFSVGLPAAAQNSKFAFSVGGGFTQPMRYSDGPLKMGYNFTASAGVNASKHVGLSAEFGYNHFGISDSTLASLSVPNGSTRIYSATLQPTFHLHPEGQFKGLDPRFQPGVAPVRRQMRGIDLPQQIELPPLDRGRRVRTADIFQ